MSSMTGQPADMETSGTHPRGRTLFDLSGIDLDARPYDRAHIERFIPHRDAMSLLDAIVWQSEDLREGIGVWEVKDDEFWVKGHFPATPLVPGVLMVEAGAQLACYLYNSRYGTASVVLFLRIEEVAIRASVGPGQTLYIQCQEIKAGRRKFKCQMQGLVDGKIAFDAQITGMRVENAD